MYEGHQDTIHFAFSHLSIQEDIDHTILEIEGTNELFIKENNYVLPTYEKTLIYPFGTRIETIECSPFNIQDVHLTKNLLLAPSPQLMSQDSSVSKVISKNPSSPQTWYTYDVGTGLDGDRRCVYVKLQLFPTQYLPDRNIIRWAQDFEILIDYQTPKQPIVFDDEYKFIVLCHPDFQNTLTDLIEHKNNRNLPTKLVTLDEIYNGQYFLVNGRDNPEKIKYFIKNAVENWGTQNVMLVGGSDYFPGRITHVYVDYGNGDAEEFISDLYYADIYDEDQEFSNWDSNNNDVFGEYDWASEYDSPDLYPDVHLGRLACTTVNELQSIINKIITYETSEAYTKDWFTNLVVIGGDTSPNDEEGVNEGEYVNQHVINIMDTFIPTKIWASEGTLSSRTNINNAISEGAGFVDFSGHGNPALWSTHPPNQPNVWIPVGNYKNTNVASLINGDKLPIVITGACSVGKFNENKDCFTWSFVQNADGGGIASIGPAALSWGYTTSYTVQALGGKMQLELFRAYADDGAITFGEMWSRGITNFISPGMDGGAHKTVEEWQPFGDPTLAIADESQAPQKPVITGPASGKSGEEYTYNAETIDIDGDQLFYLFDWGDGSFSDWIGPYDSGETATITYVWRAQGTYEIRVRAKDDHGVQSEWSDPLEISMPKDRLITSSFQRYLAQHQQIFIFLQSLFQD
jgi:hypothetical protein